ncbi:MAG: NADH-quinone oxidoreductase subunit C [Clostridiales bacterium]|nr:NADH-quinone oxidoreductase subunit C [Clostridiales bacterium]
MNIETHPADALLALAQDTKADGWRLGQVCATTIGDSVEMLYTFEKNNELKSYKFMLNAEAPELQSVTATYPYAFIYENEIHDLFGVKFKNLAVDYEGTFFRIAEKTPWNPSAAKGGEN